MYRTQFHGNDFNLNCICPKHSGHDLFLQNHVQKAIVPVSVRTTGEAQAMGGVWAVSGARGEQQGGA